MRILHLIDPGSPGGGGCTLNLLAEPLKRLNSCDQTVFIIGNSRHAALARRCGVEPDGLLQPPLNIPLLAQRALRRLVEQFEAVQGEFDIIHSWTPRSTLLARRALPDHRHIASYNVGPITGFATDLLMRNLAASRMPLLVPSLGVMREYASLGFDTEWMSILPPAVNPDSVHMGERQDVRDGWRVDDVVSDDETFVVGLLSEPVSWADVRVAAAIAARVAATGRDIRLVAHHTAARRIEALQWLRNLDLEDLIIVDDDVAEPWKMTAGLDAALLIGGELNVQDLSGTGSTLAMLTGGGRRLRPMPGVMPLLWSMAAGVPVIAEASDAVDQLVVEGETGLLVAQHSINEAAERIIRLFDDRSIGRRIGARAEQAVHDRFHISAYCVRLKEAYECTINDEPLNSVEVHDDPLHAVQPIERAVPDDDVVELAATEATA